MKLDENGHPRRNRIDLATPPEKAIRLAMGVVEAGGAHPLMTEAVVLLDKALNKVADFVEIDPGPCFSDEAMQRANEAADKFKSHVLEQAAKLASGRNVRSEHVDAIIGRMWWAQGATIN